MKKLGFRAQIFENKSYMPKLLILKKKSLEKTHFSELRKNMQKMQSK